MNIALVVLTSVLAAATLFYAWQTFNMVSEMRRARGVSVLPRLALSFNYMGPNVVFVVVRNEGLGPAFDVNATLTYEPDAVTNRWQTPVMAPGQSHRFFPKAKDGTSSLGQYDRLLLKADYLDALGASHSISEERHPKVYWESMVDSRMLYDEDALTEIKREIEKIRKAVETLARRQ